MQSIELMMNSVSPSKFLELARYRPVVDVRSPGEYAHGHIPGAVNLPLFDDLERAEVGTLYKQTGRQEALLCGLEIAGRKMKQLAEQALAVATLHDKSTDEQDSSDESTPDLLVHCWRGGMRSSSVGWLLEQVDLKVSLLDGGYRAYRNAGHELFARPIQLIVLGGLTGSGKTQLLALIAETGEQVIDLERLANHRGSAFGSVGLGAQPTVEQFENELHQRLRELDLSKRIWMEAESQSIGRAYIPLPFFRQSLSSPMIVINVPLEKRVELLTTEYSCFAKTELIESVEKIHKRLGGQNAQLAITAIEQGDFATCVKICLAYYDKSYGGPKYSENRRALREFDVCDPRNGDVAMQLVEIADSIESGPEMQALAGAAQRLG